jgi:predicted nucleotidyltransferase
MDGYREKNKKKMIKTFKESIIDIPRISYAPMVFDNANTKNPKIKSSVLKQIQDQIKVFEKEYPVLKYTLIGSILTKRYRADADLDINILFDVPEDKREDERINLSKKYLSVSNPDNIQGKLIPGSKHPINYYFITDKKTYDDQNLKADAVFDINKNIFVKRPEDYTFDMDLYIKDFNKKVQEIDVVKGELKRDIIDYDELKELKPDDILNLQFKVNSKLEEIEDDLSDIIKIGDTVDAERRAAFDSDMSPEEIKQYGIKNRLPKNVVYKMLEKYHYLKFYKKCKEILDDGKVTDAEIDSLKTESAVSAWKTLIRKTIHAPRLAAGIQLYIKYMKQGMKDAKNKAAQHAGIDYNEFGKAVRDAGLPEQLQTFTEARRKSMAFTFGRFNPPTIGHEKLINKVASVRADDYRIYLSRSEDPKKNPLSARDKLSVMKSMFPRHARKIEINTTNMVLDICTKLYKQGVTEIFMVVGSDRVREFETMINKYNDIKSRHGHYNFDNVNVLSAGERDPDAEGASGMSASKMRAAASKGDLASFKRGLPRGTNADQLMKQVRRGMQLAANYIYGKNLKPIASLEEFEQQQIRDLYIRDQIFNIGDEVDYIKEDMKGKIVRKGTNYIVLEDNKNNLHKAWIWDCIPISANRDVEMHEHNLDVDYGFEAVSEKKESFDIGQDYAKHTSTITPGEPNHAGFEQRGYKPAEKGSGEVASKRYVKGFVEREITKEENPRKPTEKDVKEWATSALTIDKYRSRYKEEWKAKLQEVVATMIEKL